MRKTQDRILKSYCEAKYCLKHLRKADSSFKQHDMDMLYDIFPQRKIIL